MVAEGDHLALHTLQLASLLVQIVLVLRYRCGCHTAVEAGFGDVGTGNFKTSLETKAGSLLSSPLVVVDTSRHDSLVLHAFDVILAT